MRHGLLDLLACPACRGPFALDVFGAMGAEVDEGLLSCGGCDRRYPVIAGVPRMLDEPLRSSLVTGLDAFTARHGVTLHGSESGTRGVRDAECIAVAKGFEFEWSKYTAARDEDERELARYLGDVLRPEDFRGKTVLDAGCGQGRLAHFVATFGARAVVALDLSEAILQGEEHLAPFEDRVHRVQGDIFALPFGAVFDIIYSIGVLHHLPEPERGFRELVARVRSRGQVFAWTYGESAVVPPLRAARRLTARLPHALMWPLSFPPAGGLYALNLVYRAARAIPGLGPLADRIPFHQYSDQSFRKLWITALDHLTTPIVHYYRREEMEAWLERAGLEDRVVSERWAGRAGSTWRICGTRPAGAAPAGG